MSERAETRKTRGALGFSKSLVYNFSRFFAISPLFSPQFEIFGEEDEGCNMALRRSY